MYYLLGSDTSKYSIMAATPAICIDCNQVVTDDDDGCECDVCELWFHAECQNVTPIVYQAITDEQERLSWYCNYCHRGAKKLIKKIKKIEKKQDDDTKEIKSAVERITKLEESNNTTSERITKLEENNNETGGNPVNIDTLVASKVSEEIEEYRERELRKLNIILHNVPESKEESVEERRADDTRMIKEIARKINVLQIEITKIVRLGEKPEAGKNRLMRVTLENTTQKRNMLQNAKKLRDAKDGIMDKIYISPDLSKKAREKGKKLRDELNRRRKNGEANLVISKGKIITKETNEQPFRDEDNRGAETT